MVNGNVLCIKLMFNPISRFNFFKKRVCLVKQFILELDFVFLVWKYVELYNKKIVLKFFIV